MISPFGIANVKQLCPNVSRDPIRPVMNRWRRQGRLAMMGRGIWLKLEPVPKIQKRCMC